MEESLRLLNNDNRLTISVCECSGCENAECNQEYFHDDQRSFERYDRYSIEANKSYSIYINIIDYSVSFSQVDTQKTHYLQ